VWSDLRKTREETALKHPGLFPAALARRVIECFLPPQGRVVLDPFCGAGSTVLAAHELGKVGIGLDINAEYISKARNRLGKCREGCRFVCADAAGLLSHIQRRSVDLVVTSPPYWNVLARRRSADRKAIRNYGDSPADLSRITDYPAFVAALGRVFRKVKAALRPGAYCLVVVMDLRQGHRFYPFHADLAAELQRIGFLLDDIIIWDRRHEYNLFRPLGYPYVFRVNKAHEFVMVFQRAARP
jgi:DNA modification methylase